MKKLSTAILTMTAAAAVMLGTATQVYAGHHFDHQQQQERTLTVPACAYECGELPNPSCEIHSASACRTGHTADCGHQSTVSSPAYRHHRGTGHHE